MATGSYRPPTENIYVFNCPICLERFTIPKYLPCLHTFCEHCLQSYIESTAANTGKQLSINCPVCRKTVQCNDRNVTIGTWAKSLPLNHLICSLMDTSSKGENSVSKLCKGCERVHESVPATSWCQECAEPLCDTCKIVHNRIKYFTNHDIVPVDTVKDTDARLLYIEEPCPYHRGKVFEVYCLDHKALCCSVCFATQHRACSDVQSIEEVSEHVGTDSLDAFTDTITEVVEIVDRALVSKRENILSLDSEQDKITQQMVDKVQSIKAKLDSLCEEFKIASQASHLKWRTKLLSVQEVLEGVKKTAANAQSLLKAVTSKGNKKQTFVTAESLRLQLIDHMTLMEPHVDTDKEVHVKLHEATEIPNLYRIQELGHVEENLSDGKYWDELKDAATKLRQHTVLVHPRLSDPPDLMLSGNPFDWTVEHCGIIECKLEGDEKQTDISGGTFLSNENLIFVDRGNRKLKAYDLSGKLLTTLLVPSIPYDATRADNPNEFFVTYSNESRCTVEKCVLSDAITIVSSFKAPTDVSGISYAGDVLVLGSDSEVYTVSVTDGKVISRAKGGNGRIWMNHITASCTFGRLVHADGFQVVCRTTQMQEIFRYKGSVCTPRGLALDLQGNVYVCDHMLHCVFQIQSDGAHCRKLPIEFKRIKQPYGIGFHPDENTFFVTEYDGGVVELFKLKQK